jgi:alanine-glyoxylate transaminase/serine-glyoxylate transaminase/serine-pyruvate transaminase
VFSTQVYALREGLALLAEEGLEKCWDRHRKCADRLHKGKTIEIL